MGFDFFGPAQQAPLTYAKIETGCLKIAPARWLSSFVQLRRMLCRCSLRRPNCFELDAAFPSVEDEVD